MSQWRSRAAASTLSMSTPRHLCPGKRRHSNSPCRSPRAHSSASRVLTSLGCAFWHRPNLESPLRRPPFHPTNFLTWLQISDASMLQTLTYGVEKVAGAVKVVRGGMEEMMRESPAGFWANCALPRASDVTTSKPFDASDAPTGTGGPSR
mmetsp:Transcript_17045/g.47584  ORF Transcript_17045/g.47584 Transcript_17045/m.47584 type:complete len:150 (-) Transcript_17045:1902-2351(-)